MKNKNSERECSVLSSFSNCCKSKVNGYAPFLDEKQTNYSNNKATERV